MKKIFTLLALCMVIACTSTKMFMETTAFQSYLNNNKGLYVGFVKQCKSTQSFLRGNSQYNPEEYCECLPKAIAYCVYSQEKISGENVSAGVFKNCITQGSNTCKTTSANNKMDIINRVIFNY